MKRPIVIGIAVTAVIATIYAAYKLLVKPSASSSSNPSPATGSPLKGDYIQVTPGGSSAFHFAAPRPAAGSFTHGDKVEISGAVPFAGTYAVEKTWIDDAGNLGAIYLTAPAFNQLKVQSGAKIVSYNGQYTISKV